MAHLAHVRKFLSIIRDAGLTLKLEKCDFAISQVTFVGHIIGSGRHGVDPNTVACVETMKPPTTKKEDSTKHARKCCINNMCRRQWHKFVTLMLWALREVPNATTGASPYMLVYGRNHRRPSAVLKESWTGENDTGASLAQPVEAYLIDLRSKLSEAAEFAQGHTEATQQSHVAHYNLRARQKKFQEGDHVIVLAPENTGKMGNRWLGPGTIVKAKSPYSYLVDLGNGNIRHLHANKMRHFIVRVQGCGVIA